MIQIKDWFPVAYHEAAHAVAIIALGGEVEKALIWRDYPKLYISPYGRERNIMGIVEGGEFFLPIGINYRQTIATAPPGVDRVELTKNVVSRMKREIIKCFAGPWGEGDWCLNKKMSVENRRWNMRLFPGGFEDYQRAQKVLRELQAFTGRGRLRDLEDQAFGLVKSNTAAIEGVAELLMEQELDRELIAAMCKAVKFMEID